MIASFLSLPVHATLVEAADGNSCWQRPAPRSIAEAAQMAENRNSYDQRRSRVRRTMQPAALLLSDGDLKTALAAGLLVGWSETGSRPEFDIVTAVGTSSLIAPFAFLGNAGDRFIGGLFACPPDSWAAMVRRASDMIDDRLLALIAARHRSGKRLFMAIEGNAARPSGYWNIGWMAANRQRQTKLLLVSIFEASVKRSAFPDVGPLPSAAGDRLPRNYAFRHVGAASAFLPPPLPLATLRSVYAIHNGVLRADDSASYNAKLNRNAVRHLAGGRFGLRTIHFLRKHIPGAGVRFRMTSFKPRRFFFPNGQFDALYIRDIFEKSHRQARIGNTAWVGVDVRSQ